MAGVTVNDGVSSADAELTMYLGKATLISSTLTLSGYTLENQRMGFNAQSTFVCAAWSNPTVTNSFITMHGIETASPP